MRLRPIHRNLAALAALSVLLVTLAACGGQQAVRSDAPAAAATAPKEAADQPLAKKYDRVAFQKFEADPKVEADYPGAVAECEKSALTALQAKKLFAAVEQETAGTPRKGTLRVRAKVTSLRIVSNTARMWGGVFAGSSDMALDLQLVDAATGAVVREKKLSTANNAWAAGWTLGGSDRSLPADLGKIVAEWLASIQPK